MHGGGEGGGHLSGGSRDGADSAAAQCDEAALFRCSACHQLTPPALEPARGGRSGGAVTLAEEVNRGPGRGGGGATPAIQAPAPPRTHLTLCAAAAPGGPALALVPGAETAARFLRTRLARGTGSPAICAAVRAEPGSWGLLVGSCWMVTLRLLRLLPLGSALIALKWG